MDAITRVRERGIVILRIAIGWVFLFAGLEKFLALGGKPFSAAGFLQFATAGTWPGVTLAQGEYLNPTHPFWASLGTNAGLIGVINVLVVFGEIAIGTSLILGLFTRFAAAMGTLMMTFFFIASWDFANGIVNSDAIYAILLVCVGFMGAGKVFGLDAILEKTEFVKKAPILHYVLG
jgi:thiosulfate dehydrogenase [quinone] large subunit